MKDLMIGRAGAGAGPPAIRRILAGWTAFLLITLIWAPVADPTGAPARPPEIRADAVTYRFPPVYEGETLSHAFRIENRGGTDLHVNRVTSS